jgi:predicted nucleic acid-binding protein
VVVRFLAERFRDRWFGLPPAEQRRVISELPGLGVEGGATYDALIAAGAVRAGATLVSCDERAMHVYSLMGAAVRFVS